MGLKLNDIGMGVGLKWNNIGMGVGLTWYDIGISVLHLVASLQPSNPHRFSMDGSLQLLQVGEDSGGDDLTVVLTVNIIIMNSPQTPSLVESSPASHPLCPACCVQ